MTLKELAKIAGVSISTVSKALNDSSEIGERTKARISELAELYNYQPNTVAVTLKTGKTKTIGVVVPSIQNNFFARVIMGIESVLNAAGYNIIISITNEEHQKEAQILKTLSNGVIDGFIVALAEETQVKQEITHLQKAEKSGKPIVLFDRTVAGLDYDKILVDDKTVVFNLTQHFQNCGRSAIALVSSIHRLSVGKSRKAGYLQSIEGKQEPIVVEADAEDLEEQLRGVLKKHKVDAIMALDEDASLESLKVANAMQVDIPNDLQIIGFAPEKIAKNVSPRLSTVNQHGIDIGNAAAQRLIDRLNQNSVSSKQIVINSTIDHRETS